MNTRHVASIYLLMMCPLAWSMSGIAVTAETPLPVKCIEDVAYTIPPDGTVYGLKELDIYTPTEPGPWPVLVFLHGAGQDKELYRFVSEALAAQGVVVITPSWRGIPPSVAILTETGFVEAFGDILCAVRFARGRAAEYGGDPTRVTLMGFSLGGGYGMAVALGGETAFLNMAGNDGLEACVVQDASDSPEAFVGVAGPYDAVDRPQVVDLNATHPDLWKVVSSYALIEQKSNLPLRIHLIHGERDATIPFEVSVKFHKALQTAGYNAMLTVVPDMGHGFSFASVAKEGPIILKVLQDGMRD